MVFADAALNGWDCADGDFYALALYTRGAALSCPKFSGEPFCEYSDGDAEVNESEDRGEETNGLEDNDDDDDDDDDDDLTDLIKSLGDVEVAKHDRDSGRESCDNPWHGGADPWRTPGSTRARKEC